MQDLKVTLVQANQIWEDKQANLAHYSQLLQNCSNTDIVVLPEMFHTGFSMNAAELAEKMNNSIGLDWLRLTSKEKKVAIYTSLIIEENGAYYNRGVFVIPTGEVISYNKRKCFGLAGEDKVFTPGQEKTTVEYKGWKIQLQICYDLRFPEILRNKLSANLIPSYDVLIFVANWPEKRKIHWQTLLAARAIENQSYVIGVNRIGEDGKGLLYSGDSLVADALGNIKTLPEKIEEVKTVSLSWELLEKTRRDLPFLKD